MKTIKNIHRREIASIFAFFASFLLFHLFSGLSAEAVEIPPSVHLANPLEVEIAPLVRTLDRSVTLYHWTHSQNFGLAPMESIYPSDARGVQYAQASIGGFSYPSIVGQAVGPGLYVANDPVATQEKYGGEDWALLVLPMLPRTRYLDAREEQLRLFPAPLIGFLSQNQCAARMLTELLSSQETSCRRMVIEAFDNLRISATAYSYYSANLDICPAMGSVAFVIQNVNALDWPHVGLFARGDSNLETEIETRLRIIAYFQHDSNEDKDHKFRFYPALETLSQGAQQDSWITEHTFACGTHLADFPALGPYALKARYQAVQSLAANLSNRLGAELRPERFNELVARRLFDKTRWQAISSSGVVDLQGYFRARAGFLSGWSQVAFKELHTLLVTNVISPSLQDLKGWQNSLFGPQAWVLAPGKTGVDENDFEYGIHGMRALFTQNSLKDENYKEYVFFQMNGYWQGFPFDHGQDETYFLLMNFLAEKLGLPPVLAEVIEKSSPSQLDLSDRERKVARILDRQKAMSNMAESLKIMEDCLASLSEFSKMPDRTSRCGMFSAD